MKTTKPISTISYNTKEYLQLKLEEWRKAGIISFGAFITHDPEEDEKKAHHHVYIVPSKMLQTDDLRENLKEFDPAMPNKPLGCLMFQSSKFDDWYLYGLHDPEYLASKGESREFVYCRENFWSVDEDDFDYLISQVDRGKMAPYIAMKKAHQNGLQFREWFFSSGKPMQQIYAYMKAWELITGKTLERSNHQTHE